MLIIKVTTLGIKEFYCPDSREFAALGNILSETYKYFEFNVNKCDNATSPVVCATPAEIDAVQKTLEIDLYVVNSYFDFDDYNNPIKTYIDDRFYYNLIPGFTKLSAVKIQ